MGKAITLKFRRVVRKDVINMQGPDLIKQSEPKKLQNELFQPINKATNCLVC